MYLDVRRKELVRKAIKDYQFMEYEINNQIIGGATLEELEKFVLRFRDTEITSLDSYKDYGYLDFIYKDVNMCVAWDKNGSCVSKFFEIYDSKKYEYIVEDWLRVEDYEEMLNEPKEKVLNNMVADLKFYDANNLKDNYNKCLEDIIVFLKEEF